MSDPSKQVTEAGKHRFNSAAAVCLLLLVAVALTFGRTVRHEFMHCDDEQYVYANAHVRDGLTLSGIAWAFTETHASNWHPLTWISLMLDAQLYGMRPGGYHLTNVLLHAAASILLFLILSRMTGCHWRSAFAAALFALHPLRVESVAWVAERKDVLSGLFFMMTLWAYVGYARRPFSYGRYLAVAALFALGLMAKPMLVTVPFVLLLIDYWPLGRIGRGADRTSIRRAVAEKIPLLTLTAASCVMTVMAQGAAIASAEIVPFNVRIANAAVSYISYIGQFFYPAGLAVYYPHPQGALAGWKVTVSFLALAGMTSAAWIWRRRFPYVIVGWMWYLGMLVPVIGLVQVGTQSMADRYTYLPQIGLCLALVWAAAQFASRRIRSGWVPGVAAGLILLALMGLSWRQTSNWRDSETLWRRTLACAPDNYFARYNLGIALSNHEKLDEAAVHYRKALEFRPRSVEALNNLGAVMAGLGQYGEAFAYYRKATEIAPDQARAWNNIGLALAALGRIDEAIPYYRKAIEIEPGFVDAYLNLGTVLTAAGRVAEASAANDKALALDPNLVEGQNHLGMALANSGRMAEAISHFKRALEIKPNDVNANINLGNALAVVGRIDEAMTHYQKALDMAPDNAVVHNLLGIALAGRGQMDAAVAHFQKALQIKPDYAEARKNLALALKQRGQH